MSKQSKLWSAVEAFANTTIAFSISIVITYFLWGWFFGHPVTLFESTISVIVFTAVSLIRNYIVRRIFNRIGQ